MYSPSMTKPNWQNWDDPGVAETIESYWQASIEEAAQRQALGNLCKHYLTSGNGVLEVGCGTGLVYERIVPSLVANDLYTGVDISEQMLRIARGKFPQARFLLGTGYGLDFADRSFDIALAFEVVIHIPDVGSFVRELFRVSRRAAIFSAYITGALDLEDGRGRVAGSGEFIERRYSHAYIMRELAKALPDVPLDVEVAVLRADCWAYVLTPRSGNCGPIISGIRPIPGYAEALLGGLHSRAGRN